MTSRDALVTQEKRHKEVGARERIDLETYEKLTPLHLRGDYAWQTELILDFLNDIVTSDDIIEQLFNGDYQDAKQE